MKKLFQNACLTLAKRVISSSAAAAAADGEHQPRVHQAEAKV